VIWTAVIMKIRLALFLALFFAVASIAPSFAAGERYALVIGNAKYPDAEAPLKEPINDARDIAEELKRDGFNVDIGENLTGEQMRRAFERLYGKIKPGSVALIFFSGFGVQSSRQSYMIPVDAQIWTEPDVRRDGFSLETVLGEINSRGAGVKIALIDASRRNPFERRFRSFSAGLAPVIAPNGTLVMYSAALSSVVSDSGSDRSLFVKELLKEIRTPDLMAEETLNRTRDPRLAPGTGAVDFVVARRGFLLHPQRLWPTAGEPAFDTCGHGACNATRSCSRTAAAIPAGGSTGTSASAARGAKTG
jgi:hypothetical protein